MVHRFDGPIRPDKRRFSTADVVRLSGVPDRSIRNWLAPPCCTLDLGERHFTGRLLFSLLDVLQFTVMHDLTQRVPLSRPADLAAPGLEGNYPPHTAWFLSGDLDANTRTAVLEAGFWPGDPLFLDLIRDALAGQIHIHIRAADPVSFQRACAAVRLLIEQMPPATVH